MEQLDILTSICGQPITTVEQWETFLTRMGLTPDHGVESTALIWDDGELIACGSRQENVLKCIAVDEFRQGEGLTATVLTALRQDAFQAGFDHLFLCTPQFCHDISIFYFKLNMRTNTFTNPISLNFFC